MSNHLRSNDDALHRYIVVGGAAANNYQSDLIAVFLD